MKNFTSRLKLLVVAAFAVFGLQAQAFNEITGEGGTYTVKDTQVIEHSTLAHVAYIGETIDWTAAFQSACSTLSLSEVTTANLVRVDAEGAAYAFNTNDGWAGPDAMVANCGWGTGKGVCVKAWNVNEADEVVVDGTVSYFGCFDDEWKTGQDVHAYYALVNAGDAVVLDFHITFLANPDAPEVDVPEAELDMQKVTVLGSVKVATERYTTNGYETTDVSVSAEGMAAALGVDKADLAGYFAKDVYVEGTDSIDCRSGILQLLTKTDGWLGDCYLNFDGMAGDKVEGKMIGRQYGSAARYFIQQMAYNAETEEVTFVLGQMPSSLKLGEELTAELYVMNGSKAYVIEHTLKIVAPPYNGLEDMTKVGEESITVQQHPTTDYSPVAITPNLEEAAQLLGCDVASLSLKAVAQDGGFSSQSTANNGGWWFNQEGQVCGWDSSEGGSFFFIEPAAASDYSILNVGQMPNRYQIGDESKTTLYLVNGTSYYQVHVTLQIAEKEEGDWSTYQIVATRNATIQQVPNGGYTWSEQVVSYTAAELTNLIGTSAPTLLAYAGDPGTAEGNPYTDEYSMGEKPGFWLTPEGYKINWTSAEASPWGITCQAGTTGITDGIGFKAIQFDGMGNLGNTWTGSFFLLNPENGKMLKVVLTNVIVESIEEQEIVATEDVKVSLSTKEFEVDFPLSVVAEKLGVSEDELAEAYCLSGLTSLGSYSEPVQPATGLLFDANGGVSEEGEMGIYFEAGKLIAWSNNELPEGFMANLSIRFEANSKMYVINLMLCSPDVYTGVENVKVEGQSATLYDLSGRMVSKAQKGIYIQYGKKVLR